MVFSQISPKDVNPAQIEKAHKDFAKTLNFKNIIFLVKVRDIHKIEKKNCDEKNVVKKNMLTYY